MGQCFFEKWAPRLKVMFFYVFKYSNKKTQKNHIFLKNILCCRSTSEAVIFNRQRGVLKHESIQEKLALKNKLKQIFLIRTPFRLWPPLKYYVILRPFRKDNYMLTPSFYM